MKIKLDENLPTGLAKQLDSLGHDVETVFDESLSGKDDDRIWQWVLQEGRFLITQDLDFPTSGSSHRARTPDCCWSAWASRDDWL